MPKKKSAYKKLQKDNPVGPVDKPKGYKDTPGISDNTRVVYSEERNRYSNMDDGG